jgi:endonuclease/exonuclease/phosphatase family metal-dependent hydrolase
MVKGKTLVFFLVAIFLVKSSVITVGATTPREAGAGPSGETTGYSAPDLPTYDEIIEAARSDSIPVALKSKLDTLLTTPFVSNEASLDMAEPELSRNDKLSPFIRVGFWNIEHGTSLDEIKLAAQSPEEFKRQVKYSRESIKYREALDQLEVLRSVDVLVLNEADRGLEQIGYRDVTRELASAFKMNYAYGVEFVELNPPATGAESIKNQAPAGDETKLAGVSEREKDRYEGLHGTAILSRFPIKRAALVPLTYRPYDWYKEEKRRLSVAESMRRQMGQVFFLQRFQRQIRYGARSVLIAELDVPQLPERSLTVVATQLENHCGPPGRRRQMQEVLSLIKEIKGPLILAGDLNTSGSNMRPTMITRELVRRIKSREFWTKQLVKTLTGVGLMGDVAFVSAKFAQSAFDPTSKGICFFAPNKEAEMFRDLERMRFADGYSFDFRGDARRTVNGTEGTLANSNQRSRKKGFISTHAMNRTFWAVGKSKIDWILVKGYAKSPRGANEPYKMAPHFARTLEAFNYSLGRRLSDHSPITVDLPLAEPDF